MSQFTVDLGFQYQSLKNRSRSIKAVESQAVSRGASYKELGPDIFNALFQKHPQLKPDIDFNNKYNQILRGLGQSSRFQDIRAQTKGNLNWSAIGASMLLDEISKMVDLSEEEPPEEQGEGSKDESTSGDNKGGDKSEQGEPSQNDSEGSEDTDGSNEDGEPSDNEGNKEGEGGTPSNEDKSESDNGDAEDTNEDTDSEGEGEDDLEGDGPEGEGDINDYGDSQDSDSLEKGPEVPIDEAIQQAIDNAAEKMDEMMKGIKAGHGSSIPGGDAKMVDDYTKLAQNPNLVKLLRMVGRLRLNNNFLSALSTANPEESMGVTIGNNIQRTLPRDLVRLVGDDEDFMIFMNKYNNKELLQRKYKSQERPGKGPMIVCVDLSSSMGEGGRYIWAQTIAAAMYMLAHKENRLFAVVPFNDYASISEPTNQKGRNLDVGMLSSILGMTPRGGTDFTRAWNTAIGFMRKHSGNWKNADIVFVTDGECSFDKEEWFKDKDKYNVRLFSFLLGLSDKQAHLDFGPEYMEITYPDLRHRQAMLRYIQHQFGQPAHPEAVNLEEASDAMVYVEKMDENSESQAFNLVKSAQQKKGKVVGAKR